MEIAAAALPGDEVLHCGQKRLDAGAPGAVAPGHGAYPEGDIALFGAYAVNGVACKTALTLIKEEAAKWPASAAAEPVHAPACHPSRPGHLNSSIKGLQQK